MSTARPKVVVSLITDNNDFQVHQAADARATAEREALDAQVEFADSNAIQQISQLFRWINAPPEERPAAILVEPVADAAINRVALNALQAGIGWVLINRYAPFIEELRGRFPGALVSSVLMDQLEVGRLQAEQFQRLLPNGGSVLCVQGPEKSASAQLRAEGMLAAVRGTRLQVSRIDGEWTTESGERAYLAWERLKAGSAAQVQLIGSQNDAMALGVRRVTRDHPDPAVASKWSRLLFTGVDGLPEGGRRLVDTGKLAATIIGPSHTGPAVHLVSRFLHRGQLPPSKLVQPVTSYPALHEIKAPA
jgi:ABC-type sugar transport system substrate-binding protein